MNFNPATQLNENIQAIIIGVESSDTQDTLSIEDSLNELKDLAKTAQITITEMFFQKQKKPDTS